TYGISYWAAIPQIMCHFTSFQGAYKACIDRAQQENWQVPSQRTLSRKLQRENLALPRCRPFLEFDA
ncbi:MAG: hypothetical protein ABTQ93_00975, partial [Candidatus Competibacter denitrificans]